MGSATGLLLGGYLYMRIAFPHCQRTTLQANFDASQYLGVWHELYREQDIPFEDGECVTAEYSLKDDGTVRVLNTQHYPEDDTYNQIEGYA